MDHLRDNLNSNSKVKMPSTDVQSKPSAMDTGALILTLNQLDEEHYMYPWADRFVMGFPLPSWQRAFKWSLHQQRAFIDSMWRGLDLSSYMVNNWRMTDNQHFDKFSNILLDGQQRLFTIERFITDQLAVPDSQGKLRIWSDLGLLERRRFAHTLFARSTVDVWTETELCEIYNRRNFGGTAHLESERAVSKN